MQLNEAGGSMGIPEDMKEALNNNKTKQKAKERRESGEPPVDEVNVDSVHPDVESETDTKKKPFQDVGASDIFKRLGVTLDEEDMQKIIFKGYVEKEIDVIKGHLTAKFKTLTTEEYDIIDEIITDEAKELSMSVDGYNGRKSVLTVAMGCSEFNGRAITKDVPKGEDGKPSLEQLALKRREVLEKMSASVVDRLIELHGSFTIGMNMAVRDPEELLKNS